MKAPTKSERTRSRILDAAASCFSARGFAGVTLRDIAEQAHLKAGSLYYHFDSKEALVAEVLRVGVDTAFAAARKGVERLGADADPVDRLRAALAAHLTTILAESEYASADLRILAHVPKKIRDRHLRRQRKYGAFWQELFADAVTAGRLRDDLDLSVVRMLVLGAANWAVEWYRPGRKTPEEIAEHLCAVVLNGLLV